jgi:integrase
VLFQPPVDAIQTASEELRQQAAEAAQEYAEAALAPNTRKSYASDWKHFQNWCAATNEFVMPASPNTVALYVAAIAKGWNGEPGMKPTTIARRLSAINAYHKDANLPLPASLRHPLVSRVLQGIRRTKGMALDAKKPLLLDDIQKILPELYPPIIAARDKALLLVGFTSGMRRSELAALEVSDVQPKKHGLTLVIRKSKRDQNKLGRKVEIPYGSSQATCPVRALQDWFNIAGIREGRVFRSVDNRGNPGKSLDKTSIGRIIHLLVKRAGYEDYEKYAGHSLRAGFVTAASAGGASDRQIMRQTGHKSREMIDRYSRHAEEDRLAAAGKLGL